MSLDLKGLKFVFHSKSVSEEDDKTQLENVVEDDGMGNL